MKQDNKQKMSDSMFERAKAIAQAGCLEKAIGSGMVHHLIECTLSEGLVLGLLKQGVKKVPCHIWPRVYRLWRSAARL
jgi:hypothetical protein